jgi:hypothetical protein
MKASRLLLASIFTSCASLSAAPINVLTNPGFESGDFSGWTVGGNAAKSGVVIDGISISGDDFDSLKQGVSNVRSGQFAAFAQVKGNPETVLTLTQTIPVLPNENVDLGFFVGHGQGMAIGINAGIGQTKHTRLFVDGVEVDLSAPDTQIPGGTSPSDFLEVSGSVQTGQKTQLTITFQLDGSGNFFAVNSYDDFYAMTEAAAFVAATPDQGGTAFLLLGATSLVLWIRKPRALRLIA